MPKVKLFALFDVYNAEEVDKFFCLTLYLPLISSLLTTFFNNFKVFHRQ